jgi:putative Mg2+ transporter-C (MgtC) family protein
MGDVGLQLELALRLVMAAGLGALIGAERELHNHPAGVRTHLLVAMGSAMFAVVSAYGYREFFGAEAGALNDPQRIAAQIVAGIGFLGAGAIIQSGRWVHGLTTAASLWATAAVGLACGAGDQVLAIAGTVLVVLSLGPLNSVLRRLHVRSERTIRLRVELCGLKALGRVAAATVATGSEVTGLETRRIGKGRYEAELSVKLAARVSASELVAAIDAVEDVELSDASDAAE